MNAGNRMSVQGPPQPCAAATASVVIVRLLTGMFHLQVIRVPETGDSDGVGYPM
jgi:hypothetical protein